MNRLFFAVFVVLIMASCKNMKDPVFKGIENVKMGQVGVIESMITLDIRYHNPNNFNGRLKQAEGDAWMDSTYLGHFVADSTIHIPANGEFLVPVRLMMDMKQILKNSYAALMNEQVLLRIKGSAKAGRSGFYKNFSLNYEGKQNLRALFK
jgi:LEA14-like dessication related protein